MQAGGDWESGGITVIWDTEQINEDAVVNSGVFLCLRPGFYHFSAALSPHASEKSVGLYITHNSSDGVYAR